MTALIMGVIVVTAAGIILTDKGRTLAKGFLNLFVEDVAKTPQGANAIYSQAIEEAQNDYAKADNNLKKIAGMLSMTNKKVEELNNEMKNVKEKCELLVKQGKIEDAEIVAQRIPEIEEEIQIYASKAKELSPMLEDAKTVHAHLEKKVKKLERERNTTIKRLEINKQQEELYNDLDELKTIKGTDKLLKHIKDEVQSSNERVIGAKTVHENRTSTKINRIDNDLRNSQSSAYIEELRKKYNK